MGRAKKVLLVLLSLAGVVALGVGAYLLHGECEVHQARERASESVAVGLPRAEQLGDQQRAAARARLRVGEPAASWQELVCAMQTVDTGWLIASWEQVCVVRSVDLYAAPATGSPACQSWDSTGAADPDWGISPTDAFPVSSAELAGDGWTYRCGLDILSISSYDDVVVPVAGRMATGLPPDREWLVVRITTPLTSDDIGCAPVSVLCGQPGGPTVPAGLERHT
jgi:hypothetical protein